MLRAQIFQQVVLFTVKNQFRTAYATGRGGVVIRGVAEIVEAKNGRHQIVITEIPYALNKESSS